MSKMGGRFSSPRDFAKKFGQDMKALQKGVDGALRRSVERAAADVRERAPKASGFLRESIHAVGLRVVCDAPYAAAVEYGSRPHWPPIAPIIAWVEIKGFVGAGSGAQTAKSIAWAIAYKISVEGTKPTWFMKGSIPATMRYIGLEVRGALRAL
jgi:hypothetical protein